MDLKLLAEPFHPDDIEWRVSRAGVKSGAIWCNVLAYITARAIANRLDEVCGPGNWCNTPLSVHEMRVNVVAVQVGISIRIGDQWVTKYDVSEPTDIEPAKGAFSGATKRAGSQWGIGRYLYLLDETKAVTSDVYKKGFKWARLSKDQGGDTYYWEPPQLPSWALPRQSEEEKPVTEDQIKSLKNKWRTKFAPTENSRRSIWAGFEQFVHSIDGYADAPLSELSCWTQSLVDQVKKRIESVLPGGVGPDPSVPFGT